MVKSKLIDGIFPAKLELSPAQKQELGDLADRLVAETMQANELFIASHRTLPREQWKLVKTREQVQVYRSRRSKCGDANGPQRPRLLSNNTVMERRTRVSGAATATSSPSETGSFSVCDDTSILDQARPPHVPLIVATGVVKGTVEDVAYGSLANTERAWRLRAAYVKDAMYDGQRLLATLQSPTEDDPFHFLGVKWATRDFNAFIKRRDFLFLESTGIALDWDGERVFYDLVHSIELEQCPSLEGQLGIVRCNLSICKLSRQLDKSRIAVYCRGFTDPGQGVPESVGVSFMTTGVASIANIVECSYLKKLAWAMENRAPRSGSSSKRSQTLDECAECCVCGGNLTILRSLLHTGSMCQICRRVCFYQAYSSRRQLDH